MKALTKLIQAQFNKMCKTGRLFRTNVSGDDIWKTYLESFYRDPIFRSPESSVHNCNYCHSFVRRYGNLVALDSNYEIMCLFDLPEDQVPDEYKNNMKKMSELIHCADICNIFVETLAYLQDPRTPYEAKVTARQSTYKLGVESNIKRYTKEEAELYPSAGIKPNQTIEFNHFFITIPESFIDKSGGSIEMIQSTPRQTKDVFQRGMETITPDVMQMVIDLEAQGSLLNGTSYINTVKKALKYAKEYAEFKGNKNSWCWVKSLEWGPGSAFRNTAIGELMKDLTDGKEINEACKSFNKMVDPANYMKASAPITKRQIEEAQKFVEENGYEESFQRRCATLADIDVSEILHTNTEAAQTKTKISVFDAVKATANPGKHKKSEFEKVEEVSIDKFMTDILPGCTQVEVFLQPSQEGNLMTLLTSENKSSKHIFKWDNNFSWSYKGNLAGKSMITQAVKAAGGNIDAPFRASAIWNEQREAMHTDFDIHCTEHTDSGSMKQTDEVYYGRHNINRDMSRVNGCLSLGGGVLDIDIRVPATQCNGGPAVENIFYPNLKKVRDGVYTFFVNNYNGGGNNGFRAEIYFNGNLYQYTCKHRVPSGTHEILAKITMKNGNMVKIEQGKYFVGEDEEQKEMYGLQSGEFHKVNLICQSPNYWEGKGVGNKHYFFMLQDAKADEEIRSIHNEFLCPDLLAHRKVLEVLGNQLRVASTPGQLSGLGFNATVRDEVILRLSGSFKRVIKVKF